MNIMRQANMILHTNKGNIAEPQKCPVFEFKPQRVNDSSHIKSRYRPLGFSLNKRKWVESIKHVRSGVASARIPSKWMWKIDIRMHFLSAKNSLPWPTEVIR
jgi:hypothetical protein